MLYLKEINYDGMIIFAVVGAGVTVGAGAKVAPKAMAGEDVPAAK